MESEGGHFAYLVRDGKAVRTAIALGASSLTSVQVLSGLQVGDKIVVSGSDAFNSAPHVTINP